MLHVCAQTLLQVLVGILAWDICSHEALSLCTNDGSCGRCIYYSCHDRPSSLSLVCLPQACPQDALGLVLSCIAQLWMLWQACHPRCCRHVASVVNTLHTALACGQRAASGTELGALHTHGRGGGGS